MFELKKLSKEAIPKALAKAEHYRLLNEPLEAESICLDILEVDPDNQQALVTLLLALTDKFKHQLNPAFAQAQEVLERLGDQYCKAYFGGIMYERRAKVHLGRGVPGAGRALRDGGVLSPRSRTVVRANRGRRPRSRPPRSRRRDGRSRTHRSAPGRPDRSRTGGGRALGGLAGGRWLGDPPGRALLGHGRGHG